MGDVITIHDLSVEMVRLSKRLDEDHEALVAASADWARKENRYRLAKASAYLAASGTVDERKSHVDKATDLERFECHLAEGQKVAALERVRSTRAQLSALQSVASAVRSEQEMAGRAV